MKTALLSIITVATVLIMAVAQAATYHVKQDGTGDFTVVQDAIYAAISLPSHPEHLIGRQREEIQVEVLQVD